MIRHEFNDKDSHRITCDECTPKLVAALKDIATAHARFYPYEHLVFFECRHGKFCATTAYYAEDGEKVWRIQELPKLNSQLIPEYDNVNREMIYDRPTAWDEYKED